jgi:hypothetical protein
MSVDNADKQPHWEEPVAEHGHIIFVLLQELVIPELGSIHRDPKVLSRGEAVIQHPNLDIWNNSAQCLSTRYMRRLITMVKFKPFNADESAAWRKSLEGKELPIDKLHDVVYESKSSPSLVKGNKPRYRSKQH